MNLSHNLKKIRKEHNLSQEQLAEKLGVSRQSVSKWENGEAYPEMDKMIQLCQLFNLNIDDLLNQDITELNNNKQSKNNINKFIDDFLDYITKTIDVFSAMKFKERLKCLIEQFIIIISIMVVLLIIGTFGSNILSNLISFLPDKVYYPVYNIFEALYIIAGLILGVILVLYIFKVRYLNYYVVVKDNVLDETDNSKKEKKEVIKEDIKMVEEKQKVIIRDPEHSGYKFISGLLNFLLFFVKFIFGCLGIAFCFSLIAFVIILVLSFIFIETGMFFIGSLLCLLACIIINVLILLFIYNFIISRRNKKDKMAIAFLVSLVILGSGIGYIALGISKFDILTNMDSSYYITEEKEYEMTDNLFFRTYINNIEYIESENKNVKVVYKYYPIYDMEFTAVNSGYYITSSLSNYNEAELIRKIIDDFNDKKIIDYSDFKISIYTTKENIEILNSNLNKYYKMQEVINEYENNINGLERQLLNKKMN